MRLCLLLSLSILFTVHTSAQNLVWGTGSGGDLGWIFTEDSEIDSAGNSYTVGRFLGTVDLDPSSSVLQFSTANNVNNTYITKQDSSGNLVWAKRLGTSAHNVHGHAIALSSTSIAISGVFFDTVDFDPGPNTENVVPTENGGDLFVLKLNLDGEFEWIKSIGNGGDMGTEPSDFTDIAIDESENVYVTGDYRDTLDFDPGPDSFALFAPYPPLNSPKPNIYLLKLDANGNFLWAQDYGQDYHEYHARIEIQGADLYLSGNFRDSVNFDFGGNHILSSNPVYADQVFLLKLDTAGDFKWVRRIPGRYNRGLAIDKHGRPINIGRYNGQMDFNIGTQGILEPGQTGYYGAYVVKFDTNGNFLWLNGMGGASQIHVEDVDVDMAGNVFTVGRLYTGSFDWNLNGNSDSASSSNYLSGYVQMLSSSGQHSWGHVLQISNESAAWAVNVDDKGNIYGAGRFINELDVDPTIDTFLVGEPQVVNPFKGAFVFRWYDCPYQTTIIDTVVCDSFVADNGSTYYSTVQIVDSLYTNQGCDSIVTYNLSVLNSSSASLDVTSCGEYDSPSGNIYSSSGIYYDTIPNTAGCDSIILINLEIVNVDIVDSVEACVSYTWIDGNTYSENNDSATFILNGSNGCDSVLHLALTIKKVNTSVNINAQSTGVVAQAVGATYQWLDCDSSMNPISGETNQFYVDLGGGHVAVEVTQDGCVDTSECYTLEGVGILHSANEPIQVFPNPSSSEIFVSSGQPISTIEIFNTLGEQVERSHATNHLVVSRLPSGTYLVVVNLRNGEAYRTKLIVQNGL